MEIKRHDDLNFNKFAEIRELKRHDEFYHNGDSEISDSVYDTLKDIAKLKYPTHEYFSTVGSDVKNSKVKLPFILGSLNKIKIEKDLKKWITPNNSYIASEKMDGLSIYVKYVDNKLVRATTRGNGTVGQDILEKAKIFCPTPKHNEGTLELRGEIILPGNKYKELGTSRRNVCAGIINQKSTKNCEFLQVVFYELINSSNMTQEEKNSEGKRLKKLKINFDSNNLARSKVIKSEEITIEFLSDILKSWKEKCEGIYDIDGIVIVKNESQRENEYYPKDKIAFKVDSEAILTKVIGCNWQVSRTGRIKPVIKIDPINIEGVVIKKATGFNYKFIKDNNIGIGTEVGVIRSGDVIPSIINVQSSDDIEMFNVQKCPSCKSNTYISGVDIVCSNKNCSSQIMGTISYFFTSLGVEYFSSKTVQSLMTQLDLTCIEDFYNLTSEKMTGLKGFGDKKITKILSEIKKSLNTKPEDLLNAFGIEGIGKTNSKSLLNNYDFNDLFSIKSNQMIEIIEGFGKITSEKFIEGMRDNFKLYKFLQIKGLTFKKKTGGEHGIFKNMEICLTGAGNKGRKEYKKDIENQGGSVKGITKKTDYLVTNDLESQTSKIKKAKILGIRIITYDEFENLIGE